jgi:hypothetical protein
MLDHGERSVRSRMTMRLPHIDHFNRCLFGQRLCELSQTILQKKELAAGRHQIYDWPKDAKRLRCFNATVINRRIAVRPHSNDRELFRIEDVIRKAPRDANAPTEWKIAMSLDDAATERAADSAMPATMVREQSRLMGEEYPVAHSNRRGGFDYINRYGIRAPKNDGVLNLCAERASEPMAIRSPELPIEGFASGMLTWFTSMPVDFAPSSLIRYEATDWCQHMSGIGELNWSHASTRPSLTRPYLWDIKEVVM